MLAWTARQLRARARFGRSVLELETLPGVVGGYLAGTICVPALLDAPEGVRLELECVARTTAFPRRAAEGRIRRRPPPQIPKRPRPG
jgi:hypothetical protein